MKMQHETLIKEKEMEEIKLNKRAIELDERERMLVRIHHNVLIRMKGNKK